MLWRLPQLQIGAWSARTEVVLVVGDQLDQSPAMVGLALRLDSVCIRSLETEALGHLKRLVANTQQ